MSDIAFRLIRILELIPREESTAGDKFGITAREVRDKLDEPWRGMSFRDFSERTIQRNLEKLVQLCAPYLVFGFRDKAAAKEKAYAYYWSRKSAMFNIPKMLPDEAIALDTTRRLLVPYLPSSVTDHLKPYFQLADTTLMEAEKGKRGRRWSEKIRVAVPGQSFLKPKVDSSVLNKITEALLKDHCVKFTYKNAKGEEKTHQQAHPLGIIYLGDIGYLLATSGLNKETVLSFSLHRIIDVEVIGGMKVNVPATFDIDTYIAHGTLGIPRGKPFKLEARFRGPRSKRFEETPLTEDQIGPIPESDGWFRIKATVNNTEQLRWWLLGYGKDVEVLNPPELREEIANIAAEMVQVHRTR